METCAFCGAQVPAASMDMTGHGWRCVQCATRAEIAAAQGKSRMGEHLTRAELDGIVVKGGQEAVLGLLMAAGGVAGTALSFASGAQIVIVFTGLIFGGLAMAGHGWHRRRAAQVAIAQAPDARVKR